MSLIKNLFSQKNEPIRTYDDFWMWFQKHEKTFFNAVDKGDHIERDFFTKLSPKLQELRDGFFYITGMFDENTAELVLTADGTIKNMVFVEELVNAAPNIPGWKFTALKPALDIKNVRVEMAGHVFDSDTLSFYSNDHREYPDEIDITVVHKDFNEENRSAITNGIYIFLDNYIGELNSVTTIDNVIVAGEADAGKELVPIGKLKDFLIWREKEFVEKYEGIMHDTANAEFSVLQAELENGNRLLATINTDILNWENKASHPWLLTIEIPYATKKNNGMPDDETYELLEEIENKALEELKDSDGYLNIGRQTADGVREIYFACRDFRKPSKVLHALTLQHAGIEINYDIYKDKYWRSLNRFRVR